LENLLDEELISWNTKIDIQISTPNVDDIFRVGANVSIDDGIKTDISRKGHGLDRAGKVNHLRRMKVSIVK